MLALVSALEPRGQALLLPRNLDHCDNTRRAERLDAAKVWRGGRRPVSAWLRVCAAVLTLQEQTMGNHGIKIMRRYAYVPGVPALSSSRREEGLQLRAVPQASVSLMAASCRWF